MNNTLKKVLIFGGIGGVAYALYTFYRRQISLLQNYDYKIIGAKIKSISLNKLQFDSKVRFFNKSSIEVEVQKIYIDVYLEDVLTGFIVENKPFLVAAKGSSDIDLNMTFNPQDLLKALGGVLIAGIQKKDLNFTMKGYANIRSGLVSTTLPINFTDRISAYL
jgi:LEA14-like dessication related protein